MYINERTQYTVSMRTILLSRIILSWMIGISIVMAVMVPKQSDDINTFYRWGPQADLVIMGIYVNTMPKYVGMIFYSVLNILIRNTNHNVIIPWITHNIQDNSTEANANKLNLFLPHVYEISIVSTLYSWFDWVIYINMLLSQIDIVVIELLMDLICNAFITTWYMQHIE